MSDIETAENLAYSIKDCAEVGMDGDLEFDRDTAVAIIEARDAAIRLALLDEIEPWLMHRDKGYREDVAGLLFVMRAKYSPTSKEASGG